MILSALAEAHFADRIAIEDGCCRLDYAGLHAQVNALSAVLRERGVRRLGLHADNGAAWLVADLAALAAGITAVPLPGFFSAAQLDHVLTSARLDHVLGPGEGDLTVAGARLTCRRIGAPVAADVAKITFTSGTTGRPKGVRLDAGTLDGVTDALVGLLAPLQLRRHLAVLPLATLLENVAGAYVALRMGGTVLLPPLAALGYSGAGGLQPERFVATIRRLRPHSLILVPQLLQAIVGLAEAGLAMPDSLRFVAVGGGRVAPALLHRARRCGLPVYEGYGLSECGSVVALNLPHADRPGSVGRPLPHARIEIAVDGEVLVHGPRGRGYLGEDEQPDGPVATGDLGRLDADGFLHLSGRKKDIFITAYGRNVSPEWVESELTAEPQLRQAAVFGEARPWNAAVIVSQADDASVTAAIARANARLPEYARVGAWLRATAGFTTANHQLTPNGRLRRPAIRAAYGDAIQALYGQESACPSIGIS